MATWLKQSTAVDIAIGPFLDDTDGKTAETGLTITQPDIRLKKNAGAWAQKNAAQTLSHEEAGWYEIALDTTDTNTLGILMVAVHESGALPVWREFMVVAANVYDSIVGGGDTLDVQVTGMGANVLTAAATDPDFTTEIQSGLATAAALDTVDNFLDTEIAAIISAIAALNNITVDAIWDEALSGSTTGRQLMRGFAAALLGKASGLGTTTAVFRDPADTLPVITATVDADGNRSAVTLDLDDTP
jgi:hypothetical protein